ncbi:MAG: hypothetical protein QG582_427 [Candidatus Thermoplasmatota archaeon]|nr:hypothetical protein [Candidatus Thermoplasmatota archaeon]
MSETAGSPPKGSGWVGSKTGAVVIAAAAVALAFVLIIAFMLSPSMSPLASVHDKDGDGYVGAVDDFPDDASEWNDLDGDGVGDNSDAFADDANETLDSDSDGVGDNSDDFPDDPDEWYDTDGDGWGDNVDVFPDDPDRASPMMSTSTSMFDGHLVCMVVDLYPEFPWSDLRITMSIDSETVAWEPDSEDLDGEDSRSTYEYETYDLGTIRVYLLVDDGEGDGMVSELDGFAIYPEDGSFDSGVEYTYAFEYEPTEYTFTGGSF